MTASQIPFDAGAFIMPVVDYEPPPLNDVGSIPRLAPAPAAPHPSPRPVAASAESAALTVPSDVSLPPAVAAFADGALRRVLEVVDRRRPIAQLRGTLPPALLDMVFTLARTAEPDKAAVLRRVRLRVVAVDEDDPHRPTAAEVFATYSRGRRVRAIAGRIEATEGRWRLVALQVG